MQYWFKTHLQRGISELIFYGDLDYKFKRTVFKKIIKRYKKVGYNLDIMDSLRAWR